MGICGLSVGTPVPSASCRLALECTSAVQCQPTAGTPVASAIPVPAYRLALQCPVPALWAGLEHLSPVPVALCAPWLAARASLTAALCILLSSPSLLPPSPRSGISAAYDRGHAFGDRPGPTYAPRVPTRRRAAHFFVIRARAVGGFRR